MSVPGPICMGGVSVPLRAVGHGTGPISGGGACFALCAADLNAGAFAAADARPAAPNGAFLVENSGTGPSAEPLVSGAVATCVSRFCRKGETGRTAAVNLPGSSVSGGGGLRSPAPKPAVIRPAPKKAPTVAAPTSPSERR